MSSLTTRSTPLSDEPSSTLEKRTWKLAERLVDLARGQLVAERRFLSTSLDLLRPSPARLDSPLACDGANLHVDAAKLLAQFSHAREVPVHDLAHVLAHCLLLHPFADSSLDADAWNLACDIVAEDIARELLGPRPSQRGTQIDAVLGQLSRELETALSAEKLYRRLCDGAHAEERHSWATLFRVDSHELWPPSAAEGGRGGARDNAESRDATDDGSTSAAPSENVAQQERPSQTNAQTTSAQRPEAHSEHSSSGGTSAQASADDTDSGSSPDAIRTDQLREAGTRRQDSAERSPSAWPQEGTPPRPVPLTDAARQRAEQAWRRAAQSMRIDLETLSRSRGDGAGTLVHALDVSAHKPVDYREFLRQFAVERENLRLSDDEFDYVFYTYGLQLYGNLPLVEPLEYRNERRIRDFAIVIDTSSSVSAKVVQEFVNTTFDVLSSESGFFTRTNIHIIQADARVQSDAKITSMADLDRWRRTIKLHGFGGTDFRPAFAYVQELRQAGEFEDLQGLVYFTDGWGIYPRRVPPYKCAFVFYDEDHRPELVPPWALQVVLHPGQFESMSVY